MRETLIKLDDVNVELKKALNIKDGKTNCEFVESAVSKA